MTKKQQHDEDLQDWRWHKFRGRIMYERDGHCERCSELRHRQLNVHHKFYDERHLWEYNDDEVELLCRKCHKAEHGIESKKVSRLRRYCTIAQQYVRWRTIDLVTLLVIQKESATWARKYRHYRGLYTAARYKLDHPGLTGLALFLVDATLGIHRPDGNRPIAKFDPHAEPVSLESLLARRGSKQRM